DLVDESAQPLPQLRVVGPLRPARSGTGLGNGRGAGPRGEGQRRGIENRSGHRYGSEAGVTLRRATDTTGAAGDGNERGAPRSAARICSSASRARPPATVPSPPLEPSAPSASIESTSRSTPS